MPLSGQRVMLENAGRYKHGCGLQDFLKVSRFSALSIFRIAALTSITGLPASNLTRVVGEQSACVFVVVAGWQLPACPSEWS